ncbi:ATPase, T2SS/T4P/T4SS family [Undibacterium arcticum]|uniref:ATPase, T2SS/T4P/T4SS family n=1 Tax=Undibacterium arcticum TaxID=1762892 RepID=UPI003621C400
MGANDLVLEAQVISNSGPIQVPIADREKVCLTADGILYVAQSYKQDMSVMSYIELLKHMDVEYRMVVVSVEQIQKLYAGAQSKTVQNDSSFRQKQIAALIGEAVKEGASDLHFRNGEKSTAVLMRVDGYLEPLHSYNSEDGEALCATMYGSMTDVADTQYKKGTSQDGRIKREFLKSMGLYSARIATRPTNYSNLVVLRLLYNAGMKKSLLELGYDNDRQIPLIRRMTKRTTGINIFSGPTGSGKSTSLDALLSEMMKQMGSKSIC